MEENQHPRTTEHNNRTQQQNTTTEHNNRTQHNTCLTLSPFTPVSYYNITPHCIITFFSTTISYSCNKFSFFYFIILFATIFFIPVINFHFLFHIFVLLFLISVITFLFYFIFFLYYFICLYHNLYFPISHFFLLLLFLICHNFSCSISNVPNLLVVHPSRFTLPQIQDISGVSSPTDHFTPLRPVPYKPLTFLHP